MTHEKEGSCLKRRGVIKVKDQGVEIREKSSCWFEFCLVPEFHCKFDMIFPYSFMSNCQKHFFWYIQWFRNGAAGLAKKDVLSSKSCNLAEKICSCFRSGWMGKLSFLILTSEICCKRKVTGGGETLEFQENIIFPFGWRWILGWRCHCP